MRKVLQNSRWRSRFTDDKIFASVFVLLFLFLALPALFGGARIGAVNWGDYDATLREVGLDYTPAYVDNANRYYTHVVETYRFTSLDHYRILQLTPTGSILYPVTLARIYGALSGQPFSTQQLAAVYIALIAIAMYSLLKNAYRLLGVPAIVLAIGFLFLFTGPEIIGWLNSLYEEGVILTGSFLYASALLAAAMAQRGRWTCLIPLYANGVFLSLAKEGLFLPVGCFVLASLAVMTAYHRPLDRRRLRYAIVSITALVIAGSVVLGYHLDSDVYTSTANRYDAVYGGLLTSAQDPAAEIAELGLPPESVADIGLSIYYEEDAYAVNPRSPEAQRAIFDKISVERLAGYYVRHPGRLIDMASELLKSDGAYDTSRLMYVEPDADGLPRAITAEGPWNILRAALAKGSHVLYAALCALFLAFAVVGFLSHERGPARVMAVLALMTPGMLAALIIMQVLLYAFAYASHALFPLKLAADWMLLIGAQILVLMACRVGSFLRDEKFSPQHAAVASTPPSRGRPTQNAAMQALLHSGRQGWDWVQARILSTPRRGALVCTALAALTLCLVLFLPPHIGVRNNGDYERVMADLGVSWSVPQDRESSFYTNIEEYAWLEADLSRLTLPNPGLAQVYLGALMRLLPASMAMDTYSTYRATVGYAGVLIACLYVIFRSIFTFFSARRALLLNALLIVLLLGKMHLGWLNSLYGEGLEFLGLIMVGACGLSILAAPRGKCAGKFLLLTFCGQFLISSKGQAALTAPGVIMLLAVLGVYHITGIRRSAPMLRAACAVCLAAMIGYTGCFAVAIFQNNQRSNAQHTEWQAFFNGALLLADDPEQVLHDFELEPRLSADIGKHAYLPDDQYVYAPTSEEAQTLIFSKVSTLKLLAYYLRHPSMLWRALEHSARAAQAEMPDWFVYDGQWDTSPQNPVDRFTLWETARPRFVPGNAVTYLLFYLATGVYALVLLIRRRKDADKRRLLLYCFYVGILLISALQFPLSVLGNGLVDNVKQLYLHRVSFDLALLIAAAESVALLVRWVHRYEAKAEHINTTTEPEVDGL